MHVFFFIHVGCWKQGASPWALKAAGTPPSGAPGDEGDVLPCHRPYAYLCFDFDFNLICVLSHATLIFFCCVGLILQSELVRKFKVALMAAQFLPAETNYMELPGLHDQVVIGDLAERSFALWVEVANRLRPPTDIKVHEVVLLAFFSIAASLIRIFILHTGEARRSIYLCI
jgi:hypothetical protein